MKSSVRHYEDFKSKARALTRLNGEVEDVDADGGSSGAPTEPVTVCIIVVYSTDV